jgi:hypothetical protein
MIWIWAAVALAVAGLVPIAVLVARVLAALRGLTREIERAATRLGPAQGRLRSVIGASRRPEG